MVLSLRWVKRKETSFGSRASSESSFQIHLDPISRLFSKWKPLRQSLECVKRTPTASCQGPFPKMRNVDRAIGHHPDPDSKRQPRTLARARPQQDCAWILSRVKDLLTHLAGQPQPPQRLVSKRRRAWRTCHLAAWRPLPLTAHGSFRPPRRNEL